MRIIIENGERQIKGSVADKKAFASVQDSLASIMTHAGGPLAVQADEALASLQGFMKRLDDTGVVWAAERVKSEATK